MGPHPCFCFCMYTDSICSFCISIFENFVFGFANRKISRVEFPMIGKSGFFKDHSLSRRHKQYISILKKLRVYKFCFLENIRFYISKYLYFWLYKAISIFYIIRTVIKPFLYTYCICVHLFCTT